jgi:transcriptional regulator with XRE-family HTH domain
MDQEKVGKYIYNLRKKNHLSQSEFAERLNVTSQAVSKWENGRGIPDIELLKKISEEFNVNIESILNGKTIKKVEHKRNYLLGILILIVAGLIVYSLNKKSNFEFANIKSENSSFDIKGVAAYSSEKNAIYISNIDYKNVDSSKNYVVMECALYEKNGNTDKKISQCGSIKNYQSFNSENAKSLNDLLTKIEFKVDNYSSSCSNLHNSKLYITINALNINNKVETYSIPLKLSDTCQ